MAQVPTLPDGTPVAVELFSTSILSNHKVRSKHDRFVSVLTVQRIPFVVHDLASDPEAKSRWRRKALIDPSIPGLLVHNEWRGTAEEFHEAVEFGELDLFLKIDKERLAREAAGAGLELTKDEQPAPVIKASGENGIDFIPPPLASEGSGARPELDADSTLLSLGLADLKFTDAEVDSLLAEVDAPRKPPSPPKEPVYTVAGDRIASRTYIPSANAGVKPLRLPRMPPAPTAPSVPRSSSAKYTSSQYSSAALAAEAKAITRPRRSQGGDVVSAVNGGADLPAALSHVRQQVDRHVNGQETADDLFASLGLDDLTMTDAEADAFLATGEIPPSLLGVSGQEKRWTNEGDKARHEAAARDLAERKRGLGYGLSTSASESRRLSHCARSWAQRSASGTSANSADGPTSLVAAQVQSPVEKIVPPVPEVPTHAVDAGDSTTVDLDDAPAKAPAPPHGYSSEPTSEEEKVEQPVLPVSVPERTSSLVPAPPSVPEAHLARDTQATTTAKTSIETSAQSTSTSELSPAPGSKASVNAPKPNVPGKDPVDTRADKLMTDRVEPTTSTGPPVTAPRHARPPSAATPSASATTPSNPDEARAKPKGQNVEPAVSKEAEPESVPKAEPPTSAPPPASIVTTSASPEKHMVDLAREFSGSVPAPTTSSVRLPPASPSLSPKAPSSPSFGPRSTSKQSLLDFFPPSKWERTALTSSTGSSNPIPRQDSILISSNLSASPNAQPAAPTPPPKSPLPSQPVESSTPTPEFKANTTDDPPESDKGHQRTLSDILRMADDVMADTGAGGLDSSLADYL